jgi:hypothetical protein
MKSTGSSASCGAFSCSGVMATRQREIRLPAKAKACDVCANAALRISTLHRRCLHDVIRRPLCVIQRDSGLLGRILAVKFIRHNTSRIFRAAPRRGSPVTRSRFKTLIYQPPVRKRPRSRRFSSATRSRSTFRGKRTGNCARAKPGWDDTKVFSLTAAGKLAGGGRAKPTPHRGSDDPPSKN